MAARQGGPRGAVLRAPSIWLKAAIAALCCVPVLERVWKASLVETTPLPLSLRIASSFMLPTPRRSSSWFFWNSAAFACVGRGRGVRPWGEAVGALGGRGAGGDEGGG